MQDVSLTSGVGNVPKRHAVLCGTQVPRFPKAKNRGGTKSTPRRYCPIFHFRHGHGRKWLTPYAPMKRNYGAGMMVLNIGRFASSGVGDVPELPMGFCGSGGPKCPTDYANIASLAAI